MSKIEAEAAEESAKKLAAFEKREVEKATAMANSLVDRAAKIQSAEDRAQEAKARFEAHKKLLKVGWSKTVGLVENK